MLYIFAIRLVIAVLIMSAGMDVGLSLMWAYVGSGIHPGVALPLALMQLVLALYMMNKPFFCPEHGSRD